MNFTKLVRGSYNITPAMRGGIVTIGNFDGVHKGHQQLLTSLIAQAQAAKVPSIAIIFEPHPFEYFSKENVTVPRLSRLREKFRLLVKSGLDYVVVLPFNQSLAELSASDFVTTILVKKLAPKVLIIGDDFRFGYKRAGDFKLMVEMGKALGFAVQQMPTFLVDGERVSSTRVRKLLGEGDLQKSRELLGHSYAMEGRIRLGKQLGRQWGFPTANIYLHRKLTPIKGVYTVLVHGLGSKPLPGVANVGVRPTVDGTRTLLEVHLLDFNEQIYGRYVSVEFCEKLRDEVRFANFDLLREAIAKDVVSAKNYFKNLGML